MRLLLRAGANPLISCVDGNRPIDFAATDGNITIVNMLIGRMPGLTRAQIRKYRAQATNVLLNAVVLHGPLRDVQEIVAAGADVNNLDANDTDGVGSPLMRATKRGFLPLIRFLINSGAKVNLHDREGRTALMYIGTANLYWSQLTPTLAQDNGDSHRETTRLLLQNGANVEARDGSDMTPLMFAAMGRPQAMQLMLARGAKVSDKDSGGRTALHWAAMWRDPKSIALLLRYGASVNTRASDGETPLMLASVHPDSATRKTSSAQTEALKILLSHGANPHLQDKQGQTAAQYGKTCDSDYITAS